jgi:iron complex transport system substrate-binding protein
VSPSLLLAAPAVDDATRRQFLTLLGATGLLAGCAAPSSPADAAPGPPTRTVTDDAGRSVEVPAAPQRVAVIHDEVAAHLVTIGYVPAGLAWVYDADYRATLRSFGGRPVDLAPIEDLGSGRAGEVDLERVAALAPDLVLAYLDPGPQLDALAALAPTLSIDPRSDAGGEPFQKLRFLADLVGYADRAEQQIAEYLSAVEDVRARHGAELEGLDQVYWDTGLDGLVYAYDVPAFAGNAVFADLGIPVAASVRQAADPETGYLEVSVERMAEFDAALIVLGRYDGAPTEPEVLAVLSTTFAARAGQLLPDRNANRWTYHLLQAQIDVLAEIDALLGDRALRPRT